MKKLLLATALSTVAGFAAAADKYVLDASHSQVIFSYDHLGFSTTYGMFSGFEGEIMFDADDAANSSVNVSMPSNSTNEAIDSKNSRVVSPKDRDVS